MRTIIFIGLILFCGRVHSQKSKDVFYSEKFSILETSNGQYTINPILKNSTNFQTIGLNDTVFFKLERDSSVLFRITKDSEGFLIREKRLTEDHEYKIDNSLNIVSRSIKVGNKVTKDFTYKLLHLYESHEYDYAGKLLVRITFSNDQIYSVESTPKSSRRKIYTSYFTDITTIVIDDDKESLRLSIRDGGIIYMEKTNGKITIQKTGKFEMDYSLNEINFSKLKSLESIRQTEGITVINGVEVSRL